MTEELKVVFSIQNAPDGWLWKLSINDSGKKRKWGGVRNDKQSAKNAINALLSTVWSHPRRDNVQA